MPVKKHDQENPGSQLGQIVKERNGAENELQMIEVTLGLKAEQLRKLSARMVLLRERPDDAIVLNIVKELLRDLTETRGLDDVRYMLDEVTRLRKVIDRLRRRENELLSLPSEGAGHK